MKFYMIATTHALISITEKLRSALDADAGNVACGIFIDLQKAFDTVNHEILLKKLEHYGFRGIIIDWFRSYLHERKQKVTINGYVSETRIIKHGVPQGSVLGSILFLLYRVFFYMFTNLNRLKIQSFCPFQKPFGGINLRYLCVITNYILHHACNYSLSVK